MVVHKWSHELETGIPLVDEQHQKILNVTNLFFIRHKCGHGKDGVKECLDFLGQYILYHFQAEEAYQLKCGYPNYPEHSALHKGIATQVKFFTVKIAAADYSGPIIEEFYHFLSDWINQHIYEEDLKFARYFRSVLGDEFEPPGCR